MSHAGAYRIAKWLRQSHPFAALSMLKWKRMALFGKPANEASFLSMKMQVGLGQDVRFSWCIIHIIHNNPFRFQRRNVKSWTKHVTRYAVQRAFKLLHLMQHFCECKAQTTICKRTEDQFPPPLLGIKTAFTRSCFTKYSSTGSTLSSKTKKEDKVS